jgi:hypothetical protein
MQNHLPLNTRTPLAIIVALGFVALFGGCVSQPIDRTSVSRAAKVGVIYAIDPVFRAQKIGTTVFQNKSWESAEITLDANPLAMAALKAGSKREVAIFDSRILGKFPTGNQTSAQLQAYLAQLCAEHGLDLILLLESGASGDWMTGTNAQLTGIGLFHREVFGMQKQQVFSVLRLRAFERSTGKFVGEEQQNHGQQIARVDWHASWDEYSPKEKRIILQGIDLMVKKSTAKIMAKTGLMDAPSEAENTNPFISQKAVGDSWIPEGNELQIPAHVSLEDARASILGGLQDRGWTVAESAQTEITGRLLDGRKEASVKITLSERTITMIPRMEEISADGNRKELPPHLRWHRNLKESIWQRLMDVPEPAAEKSPAM